jgi:hypothetical protein
MEIVGLGFLVDYRSMAVADLMADEGLAWMGD